MFSQWRSKRHFPMESISSAYPTTASGSSNGSSQPTTPVDSDFPHHSHSGSLRSMQHAPLSRSAGGGGVKALGRKLRPGTRDGYSGAKSPMSFAAGPRSNSRGENRLEFGGGVVPDDSPSEAERSESPPSPVTPQFGGRTGQSPMVGRTESSSAARIDGLAAQSGATGSHARIESIGTLESFDDYRSYMAFSSGSRLMDESPALTTSTNMSSPDFVTAASPAHIKPRLVAIRDKPQPPIPTSEEPEMVATPPPTSSAPTSKQPVRNSIRRVPVKNGSTSTNEFADPLSQETSMQRRPTASSLPESVSQPGSSQFGSEDFHSPERKVPSTRGDKAKEASASAANFGLGISSPEETEAARASNGANHSTTNNSLNARKHPKSSSEMSATSCTDSWGRPSFGRDGLQHGHELSKAASTASSRTQRTDLSDSVYSLGTAETSTDVHDSDQLSTIKERTDSPESVLKRQKSPLSTEPDARTPRTAASTANSSAERSVSPRSRIPVASNGPSEKQLGGIDGERRPSLSARSQTFTGGAASPTSSGPRSRRTSQSAALKDFLPPLELDAAEFRSHARTASNASSIRSRKAPPLELSALTGLRRGSAGVPPVSSAPRLVTESYTAPLPSLPFATSSSTPLLPANFSFSATRSSEPNTPNLVYEAALAKAVGKQRKARPAALALNSTALSAFSSSGNLGGTLTPNTLSFKGLASPGRMRVPPPSAPPSDPLPPIPNTPSLAPPKSPNPLNRNGSWTSIESTSAEGADNDVDPLKTPKPLRVPSANIGEASKPSLEGCLATAPSAVGQVEEHSAKSAAIDVPAVNVAGPTLTVPPALAKETLKRSSTAISIAESADSSATVVVAQAAILASSQPKHLSIVKKATPSNEEPTSTASLVASSAASRLANSRVSILSASSQETRSKKQSEEATPTKKTAIDQSGLPSPSVPRQTVSFDVEHQRSGAAPKQATTRRLATATDKPTRAPPSAWNVRHTASIAHVGSDSPSTLGTSIDSKARSEFGHGDRSDGGLRDGASSVASCHSTFSNISDRRREILNDKEALLSALNESTRQEILKRTEGRFSNAFTEVAAAFRQLQADKLLLEQIVREKTPLLSVGNNHENLSAYLSTMNAKLENSNSEIRKLLDLLEQQRNVIEQMLATQQLERETYTEDLERLHGALDEMQTELDRDRSVIVKLNEELVKAHSETVRANAEAMKMRGVVAEESRKQEKAKELLRLAKERLKEVESETLAAGGRHLRVEDDDEGDEMERLSPISPRKLPQQASSFAASASSSSSSESEVAMLRRLLEERDAELASLKLGHADAVMRGTVSSAGAAGVDETSSIADDSSSSLVEHEHEHESKEDEVIRLRQQISEQKEREKQIRTAYVYVRDELRKANTERRRSSTQSLTSGPSHPASAPGAGSGASRGRLASVLAAGDDGEDGEGKPTPVKLKRLSLPIVARASGIVSASMVSPDTANLQGSLRALNGSSPGSGEEKGSHNRRHSRQW